MCVSVCVCVYTKRRRRRRRRRRKIDGEKIVKRATERERLEHVGLITWASDHRGSKTDGGDDGNFPPRLPPPFYLKLLVYNIYTDEASSSASSFFLRFHYAARLRLAATTHITWHTYIYIYICRSRVHFASSVYIVYILPPAYQYAHIPVCSWSNKSPTSSSSETRVIQTR